MTPPPVPASWAEGSPAAAAQYEPAMATPTSWASTTGLDDDDLPAGQGTPPLFHEAPKNFDTTEFIHTLVSGDGGLLSSEKVAALAEHMKEGNGNVDGLENAFRAAVQNRQSPKNNDFENSLTAQEKNLRSAASSGDLELRSAIGQQFSRAAAAKSVEYKNLKSQADKKPFRADWVKAEWGKVVTRKEYTKSFQRVDQNKGTYMCFEKILDEEGGNMRAAVFYVTKCARMGKPWCLWNGMTERVDWLYIRKSLIETFNECWTFYEQEQPANTSGTPSTSSGSVGGGPAPAALDASAGSGAVPPVPAPQPPKRGREPALDSASAETLPKPKKAKDALNETPRKEKPQTDPVKVELTKLLTTANKLKVKFHGMTGASSLLLVTIASDSKWQWANHEMVKAPLVNACEVLKAKDTDFSRMFLSEEVKDVRKNYKDDLLKTNLTIYISDFTKAVADVEMETNRLRLMHSARTPTRKR